jgi:hypothetical protein
MANMTIRPFLPDTPNYKVLNAIRHDSTPDYRARIPEATQADITSTMEALNNYTPGWNEFVSAIINKVGLTIARNRNWTNPLAQFKRGLLGFGESIEEIQTGLVTAYVYDADQDYGEKAIFGQERPEVQADYHVINRENFYKITVKSVLLRRAFTSEGGLASFINQLMDAPTTSDNWDEYLAMRQLFPEYEANGGFFKIHIPETPDGVDVTVQARQALRTIRGAKGKLTFLSRQYNAARMPVHANPDELILITTPEFQAVLDVEGLAGLFNVAYGEVDSRIVVVDDLGIPGVKAILTTTDFFVVADTYYDTTQMPNPVGLHENFFLHHHQIISASRFVPAIAFTTGPGTEIETVDEPVTGMDAVEVHSADGAVITSVVRGMSYEVTGSAVTTPEGGVNTAVKFELIGAESSHSYVTNTAVLHVAGDETASTLTIRTTSVVDDSFSEDVELTVTGEVVIIWPNPRVETDDDADGKFELTPVEPDREGNTITIPDLKGIQYKVDGSNVPNKSTATAVAAPGTVVTAVVRDPDEYELKTGAPASWTFIAE